MVSPDAAKDELVVNKRAVALAMVEDDDDLEEPAGANTLTPSQVEQANEPKSEKTPTQSQASKSLDLHQPGAIRMQGMTPRLTNSEASSIVSSTEDIENNNENSATLEKPIVAYRVTSSHESTSSGTLVQATPDHSARYWVVCIILVLAIVGLTVGLVVSHVKDDGGNDPPIDGPLPPGSQLLVTFAYISREDGTFIEGRQYSVEIDGEKEVVTQGNHVEADCVVGPCKDNPGACRVTTDAYEEGCCFGIDCPEQTKCGENCYPGACTPIFDECISPECYTCAKGEDGQELYRMKDVTATIICADYGTVNIPGIGSYDWVVYCSEILHGGHEESNLADGEFYCQAMRKGDVMNYTLSHQVPCQYIQLGECGCGPEDVYTFGLDHPEKPCKTLDDCKFLCSDAPGANPMDLCNAFGIEWWEGSNFMEVDTFLNPWEHSQPDFDIIIH